VVGVAVGVEDGVDVAEVLADGLGVEVGAGVDEDGVVIVGEADGGPGAAIARVSGGRDGGGTDRAVAAERGNAHGGAGTQESEGCLHRLANYARAGGIGTATGGRSGFGGGRAGEGLGDLEEGHAEFEEGAFEEAGLVGGEVAFGFFGEDGEHVDALTGAHEVDLGLLAFLGGSAELHHGGEVDGLDELVEAHGWGVVGARVCGTDGGVEAVGSHLVGATGLLGLLGCGRGGQVVVGLFSFRRCGRWLGNGCGSWRGCGCGWFAAFFLGGWVGVGAGLAVEGELAAICNDERLVLFRHD
jgi:hypothetical protein